MHAHALLLLGIGCRQLAPHMHLLGQQIRLTAVGPDDEVTCMIDIEDWDFELQEFYWFEDALTLEEGSELRLECVFDNSAANPLNPSDPPRDVKWGEGTEDEMCLTYVTYTL